MTVIPFNSTAFPDDRCEWSRAPRLGIGDLLADNSISGSGLAVVTGIRKASYHEVLDVVIAHLHAGDEDDSLSFHSTMPVRRVLDTHVTRAHGAWYVEASRGRTKVGANAPDLGPAIIDAFSWLGVFGTHDDEIADTDETPGEALMRDHGIEVRRDRGQR